MRRFLPEDPRWLQIAFLGSFVAVGLWSGLIPWWQAPACLGAAVATHFACARLRGEPAAAPLSPVITGLGLALLLRTDVAWLAAAAAVAAIASKSLIRIRGKHVFNPANLGLALAMLCTSHAWASPSQWGESTALMFWFLALGLAVVVRALRSDVSFAFLGFWVVLKLGRVLYLGQRVAVLEHQLMTGSLIVFTFFMISDPKTTPDTRLGRVIYAGIVAAVAFTLQHAFWVMNAPVWALFALSPLVPLIDVLSRGEHHRWPRAQSLQLQPAGVR